MFVIGLFILAAVIPGYAQSPLFGDELPSAVGPSDLPPLVTENEPLATDQPWGAAIPETAPSEEVISLNMRGVDITEVLRVMFRSAGENFSIEPGVSGKVTVSLENVPFNTALRTVLEQVGATFVKEEGIYKVKPEAATATGGISSIGVPQTPRRLRIVEVRFVDAEEMARIFGGRAAGAVAAYGSFGDGGGGGSIPTRTTTTSPTTSRYSGTSGISSISSTSSTSRTSGTATRSSGTPGGSTR
jgi:hypothetical protein